MPERQSLNRSKVFALIAAQQQNARGFQKGNFFHTVTVWKRRKFDFLCDFLAKVSLDVRYANEMKGDVLIRE
ncbi:MAG: hypothetical protein ACREQ4_04790 [Candidatus Binataceae bacterium]